MKKMEEPWKKEEEVRNIVTDRLLTKFEQTEPEPLKAESCVYIVLEMFSIKKFNKLKMPKTEREQVRYMSDCVISESRFSWIIVLTYQNYYHYNVKSTYKGCVTLAM